MSEKLPTIGNAAAASSPMTTPAMMGSPFAGNHGLGITTQPIGELSKAPASGKATPSTPTRPWTAEEDEALRGVMRTTPGRSWPEISKRAFPKGERNKHECCARWRILSTPKATKGQWTSEEDNQLLDLVDECGPEKWVIIATKIATRSGKQCRERWHNHLDPAIKKTPFTAEEDETIWRLYSQWGSKWAEIAKHLPGRPDNMIKNHFNTSVQRNKRKQRARAHADAEGSNAAQQEGDDYALPGITLKQEDLSDADPSSSTSASFVDSHGNPIGGGGATQPSSSGSTTTYIKVAKDRYLPYRRPIPRPSLLHNQQHSSSSSSAGLGSPSFHSPNTPLSPYLSMPTPTSATTSATSPISFSSSGGGNGTSYMRQPLSASLPPSASPSQAGFMVHSGPPGSAGGYSHPSHGSFRYPPTRGYSDSASSPATMSHEFSPPLPGSPHFSAYPQYSHARTQHGGPPPPPSGGVTFGYPRNSTNSHYQAYYPNSPISASSYTQHLPIPGSAGSGSAPMSLSRSLPAQLSNPNSPAMQPGAPSPAISEGAVVRSGHASSAAVSPAMSPVPPKVEEGERQSYFGQQQQQQVHYFPVVHHSESRQQSPKTQYSPQMEGVSSHSPTISVNEPGTTASADKQSPSRLTFRRIPGSTTENTEAGIMEYDNEQTYAVPRSARSVPSPTSPASTASTAQQRQVSQLSPLLPTIVTHRGSIGGQSRPQFLHAATTSFLSPSTERLSIHTSISSPTLSPHLSQIPPASAPPTTTSMVGNPASGSPAQASMSPQQYHHHHPHSPYYYTHQQHQQQQQGFPAVSQEHVYRPDMQQQQQANMPNWQQRHHSPLPDTQRPLPSPLSITANYQEEQRPDEEMHFPVPDRSGDKPFHEQPPQSPYVAPASTLMSASNSSNTVVSTSANAAVELSSPASSNLVTPPQQHEERMPSIHLQYEDHRSNVGLDSHGRSDVPAYNDGYEDLKDQSDWQNERRSEEEYGQETPEMNHESLQERTGAYDDEDMQ